MTRTEMACVTCHAPLNVLGDPPSYLHPLSFTTDGHEPVPVPAHSLDTIARRCDFCGDPRPVFSLAGGPVTVVAVGHTGGLAQDYGDRWAACLGCEALVAAGDLDALAARAGAKLGWAPGDPGFARVAELHAAFLHHRQPGRMLLTTTAWPPTRLTARDLPRLRDRLVRLYQGTDELPDPYSGKVRQELAEGLLTARLYWVDPEFTTVADQAATHLPETTISDFDPPAPSGLLVWAAPVTGRHTAAASWTVRDGSCRIVCYRSLGAGLEGTALQRLREQIGWLVPTSLTDTTPGRVLPAGGAAVPVVATWLLIDQRAAETVPVDLDRATRRAYARQRRPAPDVRLVRIRARVSTSRAAGTGGGGRAPLQQREWVGEHWRQQPYGPGRTQRKLIYIAPYLRGPDSKPIRASSTVRVLGSARAPRPEAEAR